MPDIVVDGLDLGELINDYTIDGNDIELDKHQFKEYLETPTRIRHSSYNYDIDGDNEVDEFSIVRRDEQDHEAAKIAANHIESIDAGGTQSGRNRRKPNMFASAFGDSAANCHSIINSEHHHQINQLSEYRPLIRITPTEDERIEHFLQEEHINNAHHSDGDNILIKSRTTQMFECHDEYASVADSYTYESRANSPASVRSPPDLTRCESMASDIGSEPIQFECKRPESGPNYSYQREDSTTSNKSNVLFNRSQSHLSELEYIKGRDDWRDDYVRCSISEEIDSDNYHHLRRHSEAADTLEYIRGREDWLLRNERYRITNRTSLAQIFEVGEPKILIQDEIDSDEYHHNFFQHETFYVTGEPGRQLSNSSKSRRQNVIVAATKFEKQSVTEAVAGCGILSSSDEITAATDSNDVHNEYPNAIPNAIMFDNGNEIDVVIEDLIKHNDDTIDNDDIEITVWDLTPESHKNNPFIFISEATTDTNPHGRSDDSEPNLNQSIDLLHPDSAELPILMESASNRSIDTDYSTVVPNDFQTICEQIEDSSRISGNINEFSGGANIQTKNRPQISRDDEIQIEKKDVQIDAKDERKQEYQRNKIRAKSEKIDLITTSLLNPNEQKPPRRTLSFENVEDLIEQCSNGPWFHK